MDAVASRYLGSYKSRSTIWENYMYEKPSTHFSDHDSDVKYDEIEEKKDDKRREDT